jgi:LacI family transcriptional regulator
MGERIGLKHLAERLQLDVSTVSRALRDDPRVRPETTEAVRRLARELDYRPNASARALRGGKTGRVAVLLSPPQQRFASPIFLELLSTLDQRLRGTGRTLAVFAAQTREEEPAIVRSIVEDRLADGLVLGRTQIGDARVRYLLDRDFPFVTFGRTDWSDRHPFVEIDYEKAGRLAVAALAGSDPSALHVLAAPAGQRFADSYVRGALAEAERAGLPAPVLHRVEMTEDEGARVAAAVLQAGGGRPALACIQDSLAFGVFRAATAAGVVLGRDATVFGGQNFPGSEHTAPPLSTFSTEDARVAGLLSDRIITRLDEKDEGPFEGTVIEPRPLLRQSHLIAPAADRTADSDRANGAGME